MSDFETTENDRRLANIAQIGVIEEARYTSPPKARVRVGELLTGWLRMGQLRAGGDKDWIVYEPGEEVLVVSTSGNLTQGVIVCAINNGANQANAGSSDVRRTDFGNGSFIEHDRTSGKLSINATGDIDIIAGGKVKVNGARIDLN
ncbi:phage baseplate assembly protein V [Cognatishimia sp. MH4019]|uniref:phage baseplate assembly protein V n=1 Tax=Cognatishimia sp. MH4019 TaxID=2854030 RepID=UPI001CD2F562|nr:phage baseplate assembly protein V [Cognatishimia sp. MH4019]